MLSRNEKEIVKVRKNTMYTTSMIIAEKFEKSHHNVLRDISRIKESLTNHNRLVSDYFIEISFVNERGREYAGYEVTKKGFSALALGFKGEKAAGFKYDFIDAFDAMERMLLERAGADWKNARLQGKIERKNLTDAIKSLVDYAASQGSKNAQRYYTTITRETYKALKFIEKNETVGTAFRDTLDQLDMAFLVAAEAICQQWILKGIAMEYHYKDIYRLAMDKVIEYGTIVIATRDNRLIA